MRAKTATIVSPSQEPSTPANVGAEPQSTHLAMNVADLRYLLELVFQAGLRGLPVSLPVSEQQLVTGAGLLSELPDLVTALSIGGRCGVRR